MESRGSVLGNEAGSACANPEYQATGFQPFPVGTGEPLKASE